MIRVGSAALGISLMLFSICLQGQVSLPYSTDFEVSEGYLGGSGLATAPWLSTDIQVFVSEDAFSSGGQSVLLAADSSEFLVGSFSGTEQLNPIFVDFYLKPAAGTFDSLPSMASADSSALTSLVDDGGVGFFYVVSGDGNGGGEWQRVPTQFSLIEGVSENWVRFTYRLNYATKTWDLYLDEKLVATDIRFVNDFLTQFSEIRIKGGGLAPVYFDFFYAGSENPIFNDTDRDGISDDYEIANSLDLFQDDRYGDADFDGIPNIQEFLRDLEAGDPDTDNDGMPDGWEVASGADPLTPDDYQLSELPFAEGFENHTQTGITSSGGWRYDGELEPIITIDEVSSGSYAAKITGGDQEPVELYNLFSAEPQQVVWVDFSIRSGVLTTIPELKSKTSAGFYFGEEGILQAFDGSVLPLGAWKTLDHESVETEWQRITVRLNYTTQRWSLYLNGLRVASDFGFANPVPYFSSFGLVEQARSTSYLDDVSISYDEPDGLDDDGDGLANSAEDINRNGLVDLGETDPNLWDTDGDGLSDGYPANLQVWLIAESGVVLDAVNGVESWANQAVSGGDVTQTSASEQPVLVSDALGGKPVVRFDGVDDFLEGDAGFDAGPEDFTMILVHSRVGGHDKASPLSFSTQSGSTGAPLLRYGPEANQFGINAVGVSADGTYVDLGASYEGRFYISSVTRSGGVYGSGSTIKLRSLTDGETHVASGTQTWISDSNTGFSIGKKAFGTTHFFGGDIAEVRIYKGVLGEEELVQIEQNLATTYGLSLDQDVDGLPDDWERTIFGSLDEDAWADPDGDGVNTWREYNLGTHANAFDDFDFISKNPALKLWLNIAQGVDTDASGYVASWFDLSGNGNTATQSDSSRQPLLTAFDSEGQRFVRFDGVDDFLSGSSNFDPGADDFTLIAVTAQRPENGLSATFSYSTTDAAIGSPLLRWNRPEAGDFGINEVGVSTAGAFVSLPEGKRNDLMIVSARRVGGTTGGLNDTLKIRTLGELHTLESESSQAWSSGASESYYVGRKKYSDAGNNDYFAGDVVEILAFDTSLSDTELQEIEEYLGEKYDIELDVDADGLADAIERQYFTDLSESPDGDYDLDGLSNIREINLSMDPTVADELGPVLGESSLVAWFDTAIGLELDDQNKVSAWADQSGLLHVLSQSETVARPDVDTSSESFSSVYFDGTDDFLSGDLGFDPASGDFTVFVVHQRSGGHDKAAIFSFNLDSGITGAPLLRWGPNPNELGINNVGVGPEGAYLDLGSNYQNRFFVTSVSRSGGAVNGQDGLLQIDSEGYLGTFSSQATQSWASGQSSIFALGKKNATSGHFLGGNIAEVIVFNESLSVISRKDIRRYLVQKYNLSSDLDGDGIDNAEEDADLDGTVDTGETDPLNSDTDGDGVVDGLELLFNRDPLIADAQKRPEPDSDGNIEWKVEFEVAEGYVVGDINGQNGWLAGSSATVTNLSAGSGEQSLSISGEHALAFIYAGWFDVPDLWISFQADLLPTSLPETIEPENPTSAVFALNSSRKLVAWNNELNEWHVDTRSIDALEEGWHDYAVNLNYADKTWNLLLDGEVVFWELPFLNPDVPHFARFLIRNLPDTPDEDATFVDTIIISNREPLGLDFDGDGMINDFERQYDFLDEFDGADGEADYDGDGLVNYLEYLHGTLIDSEDSDSDNLSDYFEVYYGLNPLDPSDVSLDSDGDGMPDWWELGNGLQAYVADGSEDTDSDGLINAEEFSWQTNPNSIDTDVDGWTDGFEVAQGYNPNSAESLPLDSDDDGASDDEEVLAGTGSSDAGSFVTSQIAQFSFNDSLIGEGGEAPTGYSGFDYVSGFSGSGILMHGADKLEFQSNASLSRYQGTIAFWYKPVWESGELVTTKIWRSLFEIGNWRSKYTPPYLGIVLHRETRLLGIRQHDGTGGVTGGNINLLYTPIQWESDKWYHLAVTYDETKLKLYIDGLLAFEISRYPFTGIPNPMRFSDVGGVFDEFSTYNYVLGESDILTIYNTDNDADGLPDVWEYNTFGDLTTTDDPSADADNDGLTNQVEAGLRTNGLLADTDGDNLSDFDEANDYGTNPLSGDSDGDGLDDALEVALGSDPLSTDTDADAIDDYMEYFLGTDLLSENVLTNIVSMGGASAREQLGEWYTSAGQIVTREERGKLTYDFFIPESDVYRVEVKGWQNNQSVNSEHSDFTKIKEISLSVDDVLISEFSINQAYGNDEYGRALTMWLEAGEHSLSLLFADIINADPFLVIESINIQKIDGPDEDNDGVKDWVSNLLEGTNYTLPHSLQSHVSPAFVEGKTRFRELLPSLSVGTPAMAPDFCWYSYLPLNSSTDPTPLSVAFENNGLVSDIAVEWIAKNVFDEGEITIQAGDTLRLKMEDSSQLEGDSSILALGNSSVLSSGEVLDVLFDTAGSFDIIGTQGETVSTLTVKVIDYEFGFAAKAAKTRRLRNNVISPLPSELYAQFDEELGGVDDTNHYDVTPIEAWDFPFIARITESGAVASSTMINAFDLTYSNESHLSILEVYSDGSQLVQGVMFEKNLPASIRIELDIFVSGVVFEDGTTVKDVTLDDFDELGRYFYRFIRGANVGASVCHRTKLYDGSTYLGAIGE
ncbi:LamG-like jellyroll fold domain-containing protein [Rubellicoccus peritrichatus]|uniref:LamG-like jellyroll fold domain-containing protein n=1 Tax=Rubellicoccus peritrichatus TaxID=3080537 RepID=A0AAQ3L5U3_9BACT|nr:LamG-like jellyroll fold domain-containing protein [Puniceicoccus sp. CR14]WOO39342.1 LamG-like jellyroll fold domain-containing protein [Puniceicoccus sp. CR14]